MLDPAELRIPEEIRSKLDRYEEEVLRAIYSYGPNPEPSKKKIGRSIGICSSIVGDKIMSLKEKGLLSWRRAYRPNNIAKPLSYTIHIDQ